MRRRLKNLQPEIVKTDSPDQTFKIGYRIGQSLNAGDVILLFGGLGAGKTLLTKGLAEALGYDSDEVTSPSYSIVNQYTTDALDIYHIDLWRLENNSDISTAISLDEMIEQNNAIVIIEWAERLSDASGFSTAIKIQIDGDGDGVRTISISR